MRIPNTVMSSYRITNEFNHNITLTLTRSKLLGLLIILFLSHFYFAKLSIIQYGRPNRLPVMAFIRTSCILYSTLKYLIDLSLVIKFLIELWCTRFCVVVQNPLLYNNIFFIPTSYVILLIL